MDRGKDSIFVYYICTTSSRSTAGQLLHLQFYQKCKPVTLKMWTKSKFVLWQPHYYNSLTDKKDNKINFFEVITFFKTPSLDYILLGNFILSNSIILLEDLVRWKRGFEIFLIGQNAGDIGNKIIAGEC